MWYLFKFWSDDPNKSTLGYRLTIKVDNHMTFSRLTRQLINIY